jgi:hypothetical protein
MRTLRFGVYFSRWALVVVLATATILTVLADSSTKPGNQIDQVLRAAVNGPIWKTLLPQPGE